MIISTTKPDPARRRAGFTLVEVMIAASLGSFVLLGVLTTFLMLGRSGVAAQNYSQMEGDARRGLEEFAQDVRMANDITLNGSSPYTSITLSMPVTTP
ncbi:MAG: prepilin-type N-terminal cleavage/methylation domain-containing protein, partial [Verrucomicrobia bacterium]|nr:prepilin-type N-terminal cleavage/methylation domain-containing protein [Verrucomicrobiota bacterium]